MTVGDGGAQTSFAFAFAEVQRELKARGMARRWKSGQDGDFESSISFGFRGRNGFMHVDLYLLRDHGGLWIDMYLTAIRAPRKLRLTSSVAPLEVISLIDAFYEPSDWLGVPTVGNDPALLNHGPYKGVQGGGKWRPWGRST